MLFGEWCNLVHSVQYDLLPDHFVAFDIFDRKEGRYVATRIRNEWLIPVGIRVVAPVAVLTPLDSEARYRELLYGSDAAEQPLLSLFSTVACPVEGIYLRIDEGDFLRKTAT